MHHQEKPRRMHLLALAAAAAVGVLAPTSDSYAELGKGHRLLIEHGLQIQGMVNRHDLFNPATYAAANYTSTNWIWEIRADALGTMPWARWVHDPGQMPPTAAEAPHMDRLIALQLGDEQDLNNPVVRDSIVNWMNTARPLYPNAIVYINNFGGQVNDGALIDFVQRAQPDMIAFDTYPWRSDYNDRDVPLPHHGTPTMWYTELRRYRDIAERHGGIPFGIYRQTFAAVQDYDATVYRHPSKSEMNLNTFAALAFGAKYLTDFTYNTGASSLFDRNEQGQWLGDQLPNHRYHHLAEINQKAQNLGKALVHLTAIHDLRAKEPGELPSRFVSDDPNFPPGYTTNVLFHRGRFGGGSTGEVNPLPLNFYPDPDAPNTYSWWEFGKNDPYLTGWSRENLGAVNNGRVGDAIFAWMQPLDASLIDPENYVDQLYLMVVNGLTSPDEEADTRQRIRLNFVRQDFPGLMMLNSATGEVEVLTLNPITATRLQLELVLEGGEGVLLKFGDDPATFIPEPGMLSVVGLSGLALLRPRRARKGG
jgi:hypothetical protein